MKKEAKHLWFSFFSYINKKAIGPVQSLSVINESRTLR
ncbi:hypothetical protein FH5_01490 [Priestia endophytica]|jgi:hypothetical protein|nr:hypothetical protein FH5_01490 [Priestia endophytica]